MLILRRALLVSVLVLCATPMGGGVAIASCAQETPAAQAGRADVIAVGTVIETRQTFAAAGGVIRFRPERLLKGTLTSAVQVYLGPTHGGAITSVDYSVVVRSEQHTLYLKAVEDGSYETNSCSGSHGGGPTADEETLFGAGTLVTVSGDEGTSPLIIAAVVVLIGIAAAFVLIRARQSRP